MSAITSTSTVEEIRAAYLDGASYHENGSASQCRAFITACLAMLSLPKFVGSGPQQMALDNVRVQKELVEARRWLAGSLAAGNRRTRFSSLEGFRG